jgi:hypothetical protein
LGLKISAFYEWFKAAYGLMAGRFLKVNAAGVVRI